MSVFGIALSVTGFLRKRFPNIDNLVFTLHYRLTTALLFLFCTIVCANSLIGAPIQCIADRGVPAHVINTYCWITYSFTLPHETGKVLGTEVAHPGLGNENFQEKRYHSYYQWVPFMLFFQGLLFYIPRWVWKNWEDGRVRTILQWFYAYKIPRTEKQSQIVQYLLDSRDMYNAYAIGFIFCEALNFINVVCNIFFTDRFLGGTFLKYGSDVVSFSNMNQENRTDPMVAIFPRVTKCTFHKYGPSGSIQKHDALCVLAMNILNEKIFIFLWFWFIILAVMSAISLINTVAIFVSPKVRAFTLERKMRFSAPGAASTISKKTQIGVYILLHFLGKNLDIAVYSEILDELATRLNFSNDSSSSPSAPSTVEMSPIYPDIEKFGKNTAI